MKIRFRKHGKCDFVEIENDVGLKLILSSIGAGIRDVLFQGEYMTLSPRDDDAYLADHSAFFGKTIGPVAGRIAEGKFPGKENEFVFPVNPKNNITLHSEAWNYAFHPFAMELVDGTQGMEVRFTAHFAEKAGYPAAIDLTVKYFLFRKQARFELAFEARSSALAPLNITNHAYWNLGGKKTILPATLMIPASRCMRYDAHLLPLETVEVPTYLDFRKEKKIGAEIQNENLGGALGGIDHAFYGEAPNLDALSAHLANGDYAMDVYTEAKALQVYTYNWPVKGLRFSNGNGEMRHAGITFEPVMDAANMGKDFLVQAGQTRRVRTAYEFHAKRK